MLFIVCHLTQKKLQGGNVGKNPKTQNLWGKESSLFHCPHKSTSWNTTLLKSSLFFSCTVFSYLSEVYKVSVTYSQQRATKTFWRDTICCMFLGFSLSQFDLHSAHYGIQRARIGLYYSRKPHISYGWQKFNLNGSPSNSIKILNKSKAKHRVVKHYRWVLWEQRTTHPPCVTGFSTYFHLSLGLVEEWKGEFGNQIYASA